MVSALGLVVGGIAALTLYVLVPYFTDARRLRRFPSPGVAAFTTLWHTHAASTGLKFRAVDDAHRRLGPVVRIAPNHLSFADPRAYKDIYGHGSGLVKDDFYALAAEGGTPSVAQTTSRAEHTRKRKALAHAFSAREITTAEPRVAAAVRALCRCVHLKARGLPVSGADAYPARAMAMAMMGTGEEEEEKGSGGKDGGGGFAFDVRPWLNMFSYDAITSLFWSVPYGLLDKGNDLCPSMDEAGRVTQVHAMDSFHSASRWNAMFSTWPAALNAAARAALHYSHDRRAVRDFGGMARYLVVRRLELLQEEEQQQQQQQQEEKSKATTTTPPPPLQDLFAHLPSRPSAKWPQPMPLDELVAESATMLDAGNDTTQASLSNCLYHLALEPEKQRKLHAALSAALSSCPSSPSPSSSSGPGSADDDSDAAVDPARPILRYSTSLQHVPYLRACLDESFRCQPPVASGLPRRAVVAGPSPATVMIAGHAVAAGTTVSVPLYSLHRDERLFRDARRFVPERWLPLEEEKGGGGGGGGGGGDTAGRGGKEGKEKEKEEEMRNLKDFVLPFSLGGRACIGRNLAYMELSMAVAALVLGFEWELVVPPGAKGGRDGSSPPPPEMDLVERVNCGHRELWVRARPREGIDWASYSA